MMRFRLPAMGPPLTELRFAVALPSAASTKAGLEAEAFWRLVVLSVLIGSLVKDVDRPGVERVGAVHGGDAELSEGVGKGFVSCGIRKLRSAQFE